MPVTLHIVGHPQIYGFPNVYPFVPEPPNAGATHDVRPQLIAAKITGFDLAQFDG